MKCANCHTKTEQIDEKGLCEECAEAFNPKVEYVPAFEKKAGDKIRRAIK